MEGKRDAPAVRVEIADEVIESVFEECDRYDHEETGGRVIGHSAVDRGTLVIRANGLIEAGPMARRTRTSFFQDGNYQTDVFRRIEAEDPSIEHLGNWHTHHMNGYPTLSTGDKETYRRIVNHELHNIDFFYALLVTNRKEGRSGLNRYAVRHYVLFRGDDAVHEIDRTDVKVTDQPRIWPTEQRATDNARREDGAEDDGTHVAVAVRARDQVVLGILFPSLEPRLSRTGTFFWKGQLPLIDGSAREIRIAEIEDSGGLLYYPVVSPVSDHVAELCETSFASAAHAARALELRMNGEIFEAATTRKGHQWKS